MSKKKGSSKEEVKTVEQANVELAQAHDQLPVATGETLKAKEYVSIEDHIERIKYLLDSGVKGHREIDLAVSDAMIALEKVSSLVKFIAAAELSLQKKK